MFHGIEVEGLVAENFLSSTRDRENGFDDCSMDEVIMECHSSRQHILIRGVS